MTRLEALMNETREEIRRLRFQIAVARDNMLNHDELVAKLDVYEKWRK